MAAGSGADKDERKAYTFFEIDLSELVHPGLLERSQVLSCEIVLFLAGYKPRPFEDDFVCHI